MTFHWWWVVIAVLAIWVTGWLVTVIIAVLFNPLDSEADKRKDFGGRLKAQAVINWFLWPLFLPALLARRRFNHDLRTGKRPSWIVLGEGEEAGRAWTLSDGTELEVLVSHGSSSEPALIQVDHEGEVIKGPIEYRVRMIAPTAQPATEWEILKSKGFDSEPDPEEDDEDDDNDDESTNQYEVSVRLPRGKYEVELRVQNRAGEIEKSPPLTLIIAEPEEYD